MFESKLFQAWAGGGGAQGVYRLSRIAAAKDSLRCEPELNDG